MKIGLTGGIGCGKSTATRLFAERGWRTIEVDAIVRDLLAEDAAVAAVLRERWGGRVFGGDGRIDRKAVAQIVFGSDAELDWLEGVLHPRVRRIWQARMEACPASDWLVEIPLLFEKKLESTFDLTVCVECDPAEVAKRMTARGFSEVDLEGRRRRQLPLSEKVNRADCVLSNSGGEAFLEEQIVTLTRRIRAKQPASQTVAAAFPFPGRGGPDGNPKPKRIS
jgi:dephospho-CoA kinase